MLVPKSEFSDWFQQPISQDFFKEIERVAEGLLAELVNRKAQDVDRDTWIKGALWFAGELSGYRPEFIEDQPEYQSETQDAS